MSSNTLKLTPPDAPESPQRDDDALRDEIGEILSEQTGCKDDITWLVHQVWQLRDEIKALHRGHACLERELARLEERLDKAALVVSEMRGAV